MRLLRVTLSGQVAGSIPNVGLSGAFATGQQLNDAELVLRFAVIRYVRRMVAL